MNLIYNYFIIDYKNRTYVRHHEPAFSAGSGGES